MLTCHFQFVVLNFVSVMCSGATVSVKNFVCKNNYADEN